MYRIHVVHPADIEPLAPLLAACLAEYDAADRCQRKGLSPLDYFRCIDAAAQRHGVLDVMYLVVSTAESDVPVGFARIAHEESIPGYQSLPGDKTCMCLDEIFVLPHMRGRGAYPILIAHVRAYARHKWDAVYVYARVISATFRRELCGYGMGPIHLLIGTMDKLDLPSCAEGTAPSGEWLTRSEGVRRNWRLGESEGTSAVPEKVRNVKEGYLTTNRRGGSAKGAR